MENGETTNLNIFSPSKGSDNGREAMKNEKDIICGKCEKALLDARYDGVVLVCGHNFDANIKHRDDALAALQSENQRLREALEVLRRSDITINQSLIIDDALSPIRSDEFEVEVSKDA